jgi:hypothetical protein
MTCCFGQQLEGGIWRGRLEVVLALMQLPARPIRAVYPRRWLAAAKGRICDDFLAAMPKQQ